MFVDRHATHFNTMVVPVMARAAALAAPTEPFVIQSQSAAVLVASVLSVVGAGWMILSFIVRFCPLPSYPHQAKIGIPRCFRTSKPFDTNCSWALPLATASWH